MTPNDRPTTEALADAQRKLASVLKAERDAAEGVLVAGREASVPYLIAALAEGNVAQTSGVSPVPRAALLAGALKAREALPALYALVDGGKLDEEHRPFVARAIAELLEGQDAFDDRARRSLETLAADDDRYTRAFAAQAFGALGDLRSKARIQALAQDSDLWVREKASSVLARLAENEALAQQLSPQDFAQLANDSEAGGGILRHYLDDLGDARRTVRDAAVNELVRAGKPAVPFLLDKLNQPITRARIGAAAALGRLQSTEAAGPLLVAATAPASMPDEVELRAVALRALSSCLTGLEEGLSASILPLARDRDRFVRAAALLCLGRLAERNGLRAIVQALLEDDPFVKESAAVALSEGVRETDGDVVKPLLLALTRRSGPAVTEAILIALWRVSIDDPALRVRVRHRVRALVAGATSSMRKAAIVLLERLYAEDDPPPLPLVDDVIARLADDHPEVRVVAASFLRAHLPAGMTGAVSPLAASIARGELTVSLLALEALRRHDTPEAKAAIETVRAQHEALNARATELLHEWTPSTSLWTFQPKSAAKSEPARTRVRPKTDGDRGTVVEARFDEGQK